MSANEYLIDASTRHQIMLQRLSGGAFNKLKPILEQLQKDVKARLRDDPDKTGGVDHQNDATGYVVAYKMPVITPMTKGIKFG